MGAFLLLMLLIGTLSSQLTNGMKVVAAVTTGVLMISLSVMTSLLIRRVRGEQQTLTAITELVQLRRWPDAAMKLTGYLDGETQSHSMRAQALILLASVLARYHRFADAILVHDYLLEQGGLDPSSEFALRVGRAMAMLREDHLFDADRAISEMRRAAATGQGVDTAGLALVELYRDVKTGHPHEAIETFEKHGTVIRDQLGHRSADAWVLVARAYDLVGRAADAQAAYENATLLAPPPELFRRFPEVGKLKEKYRPAFAPPEAA